MRRTVGLSKRETEVMQCIRRGMSTREAAAWLDITPRTLQTHLQSIFEQLGVSSRLAALSKLGYMTMGDDDEREDAAVND